MPYLVRSLITYAGDFPSTASDYAILDVNGDGHFDIVLMYSKIPLENVTIPFEFLLGNGMGGFTDGTATLFPSGVPGAVSPRQVLVADFNGDGRPDLFVAGHGYDASPFPGEQNGLLLSSGATGFVDASDRLPQVSDFTHSAAAGDVDGDGDVDIVVMNISGGTPGSGELTAPYLLLNNGTGEFTRQDNYLPEDVAAREFGGKYTSCLLFDADGDGDLDLFLGSHGETTTNFSRLLYNNGTGNFGATVPVNLPAPQPWGPEGSPVVDADTVDLNGDGWLDLVLDIAVNNYGGRYIQLLINDGAGGWIDETQSRLPQPVTDGRWLRNLDIVDLNGDGYADILVRSGTGQPIYLNDGNGYFINLPASFLDTSGYFGVDWTVNYSPIDANGDGRLDIIADVGANVQSGDNTIFLFTQQDPGPSQTGSGNADGLLGDGSAETLSGLGGDDVIFGGAGNDTLSGGLGADILVGGSGEDLFRDTAASLNGDSIRDFAAGDRIIVTDASLGNFDFMLSGNTLTYTGGSMTLLGGLTGTLVAATAAEGGVQISIQASTVADAANDFDGDGRSDILWRADNGQMVNWLGTNSGGFAENGGNSFNWVDVAWQVAGTGDFNGDGRDDILWRKVDGQMVNWLGTASGGFTENSANSFNWVGTDWQVAGVGDFNGDGRDDILWRNGNSGQMLNWLANANGNGGYAENSANSFATVGTSWQVAGIGDFNGDGRDDILWRNSDGQLVDFLGTASGGYANNGANSFALVDTAWQVAGIGDFNGDGRDDILWRADNGQMVNWLANANGNGGFADNGGNSFNWVDVNWSVAAIGDYNGDGRDDILWRKVDGQMVDWLGTPTGGYADNGDDSFNWVATNWHVQPASLL